MNTDKKITCKLWREKANLLKNLHEKETILLENVEVASFEGKYQKYISLNATSLTKIQVPSFIRDTLYIQTYFTSP